MVTEYGYFEDSGGCKITPLLRRTTNRLGNELWELACWTGKRIPLLVAYGKSEPGGMWVKI